MKTSFRKFTAIALAALGVGMVTISAQAAEIRVLNWKDYGTDADWAVAAFQEQTGHTVVHDYFNSEQEMLTKLRTNPGAYDVVLINSAYTVQAKDEGLIGSIDTSEISNFSDLAPNMATNADLVPGGDVYAVAWTWGLTSFAVNTNEVEPVPDSIGIFWDPAYKGRIGWRDDPLESVQFAALATGQDINNIRDLDAVKEKLTELMPQIQAFWSSENDWNQFMAAGDFVIAPIWSGSANRSMSKGLPVQFVVPIEGAIGWLDGLSIPTTSKNKDAARAFINYMIDPAFYVQWAEGGAPASANARAAAALPVDNFNRKVLGDPAVVARVQFMQPVSDDERKTYLEMWQELKASQ